MPRKAAKIPARASANPVDRGESVSRMEPLLLAEGSRHRPALTDLAVELAARASGFRRSLPPGIFAVKHRGQVLQSNIFLECKT